MFYVFLLSFVFWPTKYWGCENESAGLGVFKWNTAELENKKGVGLLGWSLIKVYNLFTIFVIYTPFLKHLCIYTPHCNFFLRPLQAWALSLPYPWSMPRAGPANIKFHLVQELRSIDTRYALCNISFMWLPLCEHVDNHQTMSLPWYALFFSIFFF